MKAFSRLVIGSALIISLSANSLFADNWTTDVNGWGYTEIRQATLLPVILPLGIAAIMMTVAYLVEESSGSGHHHHHHHAH